MCWQIVSRELWLTIGLYTSPHLCAVRERIRINGEPISEELFAKYFFEVWERLEQDQKVGLWSLSGAAWIPLE